jgi:hypothetical protein
MVGLLRTGSAVFDLLSKHYTASSKSFAKIACHIMVTSPACGRFSSGWVDRALCPAVRHRESRVLAAAQSCRSILLGCAAAGGASHVFRQRKIRLRATNCRWKFEKRLSLQFLNFPRHRLPLPGFDACSIATCRSLWALAEHKYAASPGNFSLATFSPNFRALHR